MLHKEPTSRVILVAAALLVIISVVVFSISAMEQKTGGNPTGPNPTLQPKPSSNLTIISDQDILAKLENETYSLLYGPEITLKNGIYKKEGLAQTDILEVSVDANGFAAGDLDADGDKDAVIIVKSYTGGTGHFYQMAVFLNIDNKFIYITSSHLGDRVIINSVQTKEAIIKVNLTTQGPNDGLCCPTLKQTREFILRGSALTEITK